MRRILGFCTVCLFALPLLAEPSPFEQGLKALQNKNWDAAKDAFEKMLPSNPDEPALLYDLGLAYYQLDKRGYAVGYWRKALAISPGLSQAAAALSQIDAKYHFNRLERSPWAATLHEIFSRFDWNVWFAALAASLGLAGWLGLSALEARRQALLSENVETPGFSFGTIGACLLALLLVAGATGKYFDDLKARATVVAGAAELKSAPSEDGVTLAPVSEASEVEVLRTHEKWAQILTGDGTTGWMKLSDLLLTSEAAR